MPVWKYTLVCQFGLHAKAANGILFGRLSPNQDLYLPIEIYIRIHLSRESSILGKSKTFLGNFLDIQSEGRSEAWWLLRNIPALRQILLLALLLLPLSTSTKILLQPNFSCKNPPKTKILQQKPSNNQNSPAKILQQPKLSCKNL